MTSYNGQTLTYDAMGNPLNYRDGITLTWQNGRELASYTKDGTTVTYTYDINGMRTSKNIEGVGTVSYVYENGLLMQMDYLGYIFTFSYDVNGNPIGFELNNDSEISYYYYGANYRGDIIAIYNEAGTKIATYTYDAYGKFLSRTYTASNTTYTDTIATTYNPLRYRGYVYDTETGFYYLQSRYYDPTTCRFINADGYMSTGQDITSNNMFAYSRNNPIMHIDFSGEISVLAIIGLVVGVATLLVIPSSERQEPTNEQINAAISAANRAQLSIRKDSNGNKTIDIRIDTWDAINSVDNLAANYYYNRLYERTVIMARSHDVPERNLMSPFHIQWEYEIHKFGAYFKIDNCFPIDLNKEETIWSIAKRALGW